MLKTHFTVELPEVRAPIYTTVNLEPSNDDPFLLQIYLFHPMATSVGMSTWEVPFPKLSTILAQLALFFVMEDAWHYMSHRLLHHRSIYKYIHK